MVLVDINQTYLFGQFR